MIQRKKKRVCIFLIILAIVAVAVIGIISLLDSRNSVTTQNPPTETISFKTKSLILKTENEVGNTYDAIYVEELMRNMYVLEYETEEAAKNAYEKLKNRQDIEYITPDTEYEINNISEQIIYFQDDNGAPLASWGGTAMGLDVIQTKVNEKTSVENITIAVIDSGLQVEHPAITQFFSNRISDKSYNAFDRGTDITDENGHGTAMTGVILDGAPENIEIIPVKVFDADKKTTVTMLIRGIDYAIEQNVDIINMSLGTEGDINSEQPALQEAVETAIEAGITVVSATGNGGEDNVGDNMDNSGVTVYPAEFSDVIAVGAVKNELIEFDAERSNIKYIYRIL